VIPVLQLSSSLAQPLINHSSTTHRLAKFLSLSLSLSLSLLSLPLSLGPHIVSRNLAVPLEGYLESRRWPPRSLQGNGGKWASAFIYALGFERPGVKLMKMEEEGGEAVKGKNCKELQ